MSAEIDWIKLHFSWANSERVALMSCLGELALLRLIMACARSGSVPADPDACLSLIGKRDMKKSAVIEALKEFTPHPELPGRMIHARTIRDRTATLAKVEDIKRKKSEAGKRSAENRTKPQTDAPAPTTPVQHPFNTRSTPVETRIQQNPTGEERKGEDRIGMERSGVEWSITYSLSARGERAVASFSPDNLDWLRRELAALPPEWATVLRDAWVEWLAHLIEREQRKYPAKDIILCRPPTSTLDAHRRTLSAVPGDHDRAAWLETAIAARLGRPCEPTARPAAAGGRALNSTASDHEKGF